MNSNFIPPGTTPGAPQHTPVNQAAQGGGGVSMQNLNEILEPALEALETERKRALEQFKSKAINAGVIGFCVFCFCLLFFRNIFPQLVVLGPIGAVALIVGNIYSNAMRDYRDGFKNMVIRYIIAAVNPTLSYSPTDFVSESEFRMCQMFHDPDRYQGEDLVEGTVGATRVRFSEIHAERENRSRDSRGNTRRQYETIFKGVFFTADFNKQFNGFTLILPDNTEKYLGRFGQSLQAMTAKLSFGQRQLIKLEDPEFEKCFVVYSHDQIEARYLLSPSLMSRLLDFRAKIGHPFHMAFLANQIYMAIPTSQDIFEPPPLTKPLDASCVATYINQLSFVLGIVEDLDLNTRVWSKGTAAPGAPNGAQPPHQQQADTGINVWANP